MHYQSIALAALAVINSATAAPLEKKDAKPQLLGGQLPSGQLPKFSLPTGGFPSSPEGLPSAPAGGLPSFSTPDAAAPSPTFHLPTNMKREAQFSLPAGFSLPHFTFPGVSSETTATPVATNTAISTPSEATPTETTPTNASSTAAAPTATSTGSSSGSSSGSCAASSDTSTEDGVKNGCCAPLTFIFARGTSETGNMGSVIGPPLAKSLRSKLGADKVAVQGVDYPASAEGNANQGADGGPTMASLIKSALSNCPSTKVVTSGYSQGGMVVHNAFSAQGITSKQVSAAVIFGDPFNGQAVGDLPASDTKEYCASGDDVCNGSGTFAITQSHLSYGSDADDAAGWIVDTLGL